MTHELKDRFWRKVSAPNADGCLMWTANVGDTGYGRIIVNGKVRRAHRVAYELTKGAIPEGLQLDHLCRNRACVNPDHLEPVTQRENILRGVGFPAIHAAKTHCPSGHPYDAENTYVSPVGHRHCRICGRRRRAEYKRRASLARKQGRAA